MPFLSSSRLAYHCEYKITAMLCSSGAKDNWQCKLTAVIRRQPCSVAVAQTAAMLCSSDLCFVHVSCRRRQPPPPPAVYACSLAVHCRRQPCPVAVAQTAAMLCSIDLCFVHVRNPSRRRQPPAAAASCICMLFSSALWSCAWSAEWNAL